MAAMGRLTTDGGTPGRPQGGIRSDFPPSLGCFGFTQEISLDAET